ncbi:MAG: ABC transporter permease [Lachnospiraceae bacterium]|nr:ABC transporter permease [Lachnospiraceae bacterium]
MLEKVVLNPSKSLEWGLGIGVFSVFIGAILGVCLLFLIKEGKNFRIYLQALKKYRFLLEDMVVRDIKLKYRRSVIGLLWSILNPLLMMVVITAVFQNLFRFEIENFAVYYLTGWVVFNFVTEATSGAMTSIIGASALIRKVYIPKYIFPMQKCFFSFVNMLFSLAALFVVMLVLRVEFTWRLLLVPVPLVLALVFAIGLGMILSTVAVFFRDMIHLYSVLTMVWMYLTPIIYPEEILVGIMQTIMKLNPLYYYVDYFRQLTLYGAVPDVEQLLVMTMCSAMSLVLGVAVFKKKQDRFILFI